MWRRLRIGEEKKKKRKKERKKEETTGQYPHLLHRAAITRRGKQFKEIGHERSSKSGMEINKSYYKVCMQGP